MSDTFATSWTVGQPAPLSMGFPRQEYWSELPFPSPGDLPNPGIESKSPALAGRYSPKILDYSFFSAMELEKNKMNKETKFSQHDISSRYLNK